MKLKAEILIAFAALCGAALAADPVKETEKEAAKPVPAAAAAETDEIADFIQTLLCCRIRYL